MILHSDQGTNFNSTLFTELCKLLGILKTTALHPESDGMVERFIRTILNHLSLFVSRNQTDWDTHLSPFVLAYRSAEHEVTGLTPAEMLFGRTLRLPCNILLGRPSETPSSPNEYKKNLEVRLESVHAFARERIKLASERTKTRYDSTATDHHFKEGDLVWMYNPKRRRGLNPKLQQNWEGPYTVVNKLNDVVYRVQRSPNAKPKFIHINRPAPYRATDDSSNVGNLTQQWIVDSYLQVEANHLNFIRTHQQQLQTELYQGLADRNSSNLPSSFEGSPRNMRERCADAISIFAKYGAPDLFITFTANPKLVRNHGKFTTIRTHN
ncbi:Retrovirus-related Pol polyprotein from transposon 412 [Araneus ventricosus]|uniref:Retrovirus-related Pol polyprotein from transposon 412 n=1 Tax=Araneus ventricosus TaxID=182803 RepID=A0A4Y2CYC1_ARAVE|nr:Retrovirus-related Pol polyprotein from transposon 412 [Araneus ventricosus]